MDSSGSHRAAHQRVVADLRVKTSRALRFVFFFHQLGSFFAAVRRYFFDTPLLPDRVADRDRLSVISVFVNLPMTSAGSRKPEPA